MVEADGGRPNGGPARCDGGGRPDAVAGVDLGATNLRVVVADGEARALARSSRPTPAGPDGAAVERALADLLGATCADAGVDPSALAAVAVASTGPFEDGAVVDPANLPGIERIRPLDAVADLVGEADRRLVNDATAGVAGERRFRPDAPANLVYLTISSGIGAGVCVDGLVLRGEAGNAGEVGHLVVDPGGRPCGCGRAGHWEAYCAGEAVPDLVRDLHAAGPVDTALPLDDPGLAAADVFARAGADPLADRAIDEMARWNALGVANLVHAYAPAEVAVGGAVALGNPELVVDPIRERLPPLLVAGSPAVRVAALGEDAVVRGAVAVALDGRS